MALGQLRTILVCQTSSSSNSPGICPAGQELQSLSAYVLVPESQSYFEELNAPMDYSLLAQYMGLGFSTVMIAYCISKAIGGVIRVVR